MSERTAALQDMAQKLRIHSIAATSAAGSGHPTSCCSMAEITAVLFFDAMRYRVTAPNDFSNDRFVLSKGHAAPALYGIWVAMGLMPLHEALALRRLGACAQGHPHVLDTPLAETSTGSLGQGFSAAIGMAFGLRMKRSEARAYVLLGDGELQEGEVWEGAMFAAHYRLGNLCALVDYNKMQSDDLNANVIGLEPLAAKWRAFGWHAIEIDGHDPALILDALGRAGEERQRPSVIIAHTVKGKGVAMMERKAQWHGSVRLTREQAEAALRDLGAGADELKELLDVRFA